MICMTLIYSKKIPQIFAYYIYYTYLCSVVKKQGYMNRFLQKIIDEASSLAKTEIGLKDCSEIFNVDYSNMCAYARGSKVMPLDLACKILEYMDCRIVVFQSKKRY